MMENNFEGNLQRYSNSGDPGFPSGNVKSESINLLFGQIFSENCIKMKKIGPKWVRIPGVPISISVEGWRTNC